VPPGSSEGISDRGSEGTRRRKGKVTKDGFAQVGGEGRVV